MNSHDATDAIRTRKLALLSGGMLLVATTIFGGLSYLQRQSRGANEAAMAASVEEAIRVDAVKKGMIYDSKTGVITFPDLSPNEQELIVTKLKVIREKWRPWAFKNQASLQRIMRAHANDEATLMAVYNMLPNTREGGAISSRDLIPGGKGMAALKAGLPVFSWQPLGNGNGSRNRKIVIPENLRLSHEKAQQSLMRIVKEDFNGMRDIRLCRNISHSEPKFSLWASGRITKSKRVYKEWPEVSNGQKVMVSRHVEGAHEEIAPPFDFLR